MQIGKMGKDLVVKVRTLCGYKIICQDAIFLKGNGRPPDHGNDQRYLR
jgi:hypothetical protein